MRLAQFQKVIKINGSLVPLITFYILVENYNLFQLASQLHNPERHIILQLFTYKDITYFGITYHIMYLRLGTGSIKWYSNSPYPKSSKVHIQTFRFILRKNCYIFLYAYT